MTWTSQRKPLDAVRLFTVMQEHGVQYVVVGGLAAIAHGFSGTTRDADAVPAYDVENLDRLYISRSCSPRVRARGMPRIRDGQGVEKSWGATSLPCKSYLTALVCCRRLVDRKYPQPGVLSCVPALLRASW